MPNSKKRQAICLQTARLLKEEREKKNLSMTVTAAKAGLSQQMVSYVERGLRNPTLDTFLRITEALGVDPVKILKKASKQP